MSSPRWLVRLTIPVMAGAALARKRRNCERHSRKMTHISRNCAPSA